MLTRQESGNTLESVNKQIAELKKKVQLAEGQRKAQYEEWDNEKRLNDEKIKKIKDEIKNMYHKLTLTSTIKTNVKTKYQSEMKPLLEKESDEARKLFDLKVIDLQKKLDLLNHQVKQKEDQLMELTSTNFVISKNSVKMNKRLLNTSKEITTMENQIHLTELNAMEANHLRQNYRAIKNQLTDESVAFESILNKLEEKINERNSELSSLEKIYNEAKTYKEVAEDSLNRQEQELMKIQNQRKLELEQLKSRVEDRKYELERLERQMFSNQQTSAPPQITESDEDDSENECSKEVSQITERLEKIFSKLKQVTGVTENEDVLKRFLSQKETVDVLKRMKTTIENEKRNLERCKEEISNELESCKFVESQIAEQSNDEMANIKSSIGETEEIYEKLKEERTNSERSSKSIMKRIHEFCALLKDVDAVDVPSKCPPVEKCEWLFHILKTKLESAARKRKTIHRMETTSQRGDATNTLTQLPTLLETKISDLDDDEEEVPTRNSLKKEAQLIYETKSRRKGFRIHSTMKNIQF